MSAETILTRHWAFGEGVTLERITDGLINETWWVRDGSRAVGVLQRLNTRIFRSEVNRDLEGISSHLLARGVTVPQLVPTNSNARWVDVDGDSWRVLTVVGETTQSRLASSAQARSAGRLVGRFHAALRDLTWDFHFERPGAHDTDQHVALASSSLEDALEHRLYDQVAPVVAELVAHWGALAPELPTALPTRIIHGDLKVTNLRFAGDSAAAIIDLDTLAHGTLDIELGDALRSWCAPVAEDHGEITPDAELFEAAIAGFCEADTLSDAEQSSIVLGWERIAMELSARFAADALREVYFGWDASRYPGAGEHHLARAQAQLRLAQAVRRRRDELLLRLERAVTGASVAGLEAVPGSAEPT